MEGTLGDSLKRCNTSRGQQEQLLLPQAAHQHLWPNSHRIAKVSWKSLFCSVLFLCTARLSRGHRRRNNPVSKLKSNLTQRCNRMRRAWKENEGKTTTPQNCRGQGWGATQRDPLLPEHAQWVKWIKVKFETRYRGSKSFFHGTKAAGFMLPSMITSCPVEQRVWWSGLVGTWWSVRVHLPHSAPSSSQGHSKICGSKYVETHGP